MKLHFPNRKEAREYCKNKDLKYTAISDTGLRGSPVRWIVDAPSPEFRAGCQYKLSDVEGFIRYPSQVSPSPSQIAQSREIQEKGNGIVKIASVDDKTGTAYIELRGKNYTFRTLAQAEAIFFKELAEEVTQTVATPAPAVKPIGAKATPVIEAKPDLEAELDGVAPVAPTKESDKFEVDHDYVLIDERGFIESMIGANGNIVRTVKRDFDGVYSVRRVSFDDPNGVDLKQKFTNNFLLQSERKYFKDITVPVAVAVPDTKEQTLAKRIVELDKQIVADKDSLKAAISAVDVQEAALRELVQQRLKLNAELVTLVLSK